MAFTTFAAISMKFIGIISKSVARTSQYIHIHVHASANVDNLLDNLLYVNILTILLLITIQVKMLIEVSFRYSCTKCDLCIL